MIESYFCKTKDPYENIIWEERDLLINNKKHTVEAPKNWSDLAVKIVAGKYFAKEETSVKQLIDRVSAFLAKRGNELGYFNKREMAIFEKEIAWLCVHQYGAFNSPVWFNVGLKEAYGYIGNSHNYHYDIEKNKAIKSTDTYTYPQASACFIQSVDDNMDDIMRLARSEAMLFKHGSGNGTNLSTIRSAKESLSGGGKPSGTLSFMKIYDQVAGVVKSGGKTRRASILRCLDTDHPDIKEFINCKLKEEEKAKALIAYGFDGSFDGEAYSSVQYQNANHSIRASNDFMKAVKNKDKWNTKAVTTGDVIDQYKAVDLFNNICEATKECGDPGLQFDDTINEWHTCKEAGRIRASNPCSEFMFIDNSACNLASLNLSKFVEKGQIATTDLINAVERFIIAQDILVSVGSYPEKNITENSYHYRPLGLGYCDLGSVLMNNGVEYDSERGRNLCANITSLLTGAAYLTSTSLARKLGAYTEFETNRKSAMDVLKKHIRAAETLLSSEVWEKVYQEALKYGLRNSQVTVLAPTGTIGFMMDANTTGVEPELALIKYKTMVGGETVKLVNPNVKKALKVLQYSDDDISGIVEHIASTGNIQTPLLKDIHLGVFDCAFKSSGGNRCLTWKAHIDMMAAAQPHLSGAISKTVNMPKESTKKDIYDAYMYAWEKGLKSVAIFVDASKTNQPMSTQKPQKNKPVEARTRLPDTRHSLTHKFMIGGHEGYLTAGLYEDGSPGEMFINISKEGTTMRGLLDVIGTLFSIARQYGVPLETLVNKLMWMQFEPQGMTSNKEIPFAKSIVDYIGRWLKSEFIDKTKEEVNDNDFKIDMPTKVCPECGGNATPNGSCFRCNECGASLGCS